MRVFRFFQVWICVAILAFLSGLPIVGAASLYWDGSSSGADADGGIGMWITGSATTNWDTSAIGGNDVPWTDGSDAVFGGTGGLVTVSGTVSASSLSFGAAGYSLSGGRVTLTGTPVISIAGNDVVLDSIIAGSVAISKTGTGTLTISGANTYTGVFTVAEGTVKAGSATAFGSTQKGTIISPGATLELNGLNLGTEQITFSGAGVGGAGAIVNNGSSDLNALQYATLAGPATVGGTRRWDMRGNGSLNMGGHMLTKTGPGDFHLVTTAVTSPGNIDVKEGSFWVENASTLAGTAANVINIRNGAMLAQWSNGSNTQPRTASFETNTTWHSTFGSSRWDGPVMLAGTMTLDVANNALMSHYGVISGPGSLTKTGAGTWTVSSLNTYTGGTHVNTGKVVLNAGKDGIGTLRGAVTVNSGGIVELAVAETLGNLPGARVSPLMINGGLVENTSNGGNSCDVVNLAGGTLRSGAGVNSPTAKSYFTLAGGSAVNSLAAEIPSVISGRLDLGSGMTGTPTSFNVDVGNATEGLRIDAAITESTSDHGITKAGIGLMALNGECLFTGGTSVQAGTLVLAAGGSLPGSPVTVKTGGRFGTTTAGKRLASLVADPGSSLVLPAQAGNTTTITGELALSGGTIGISPVLGAGTVAGTYDLVTAGGITGAGTPVLDMAGAFGSTRAFGSLAVNGNKLQLILSGTGANLVWSNASAGGSATGTWDTTLANFSHDGGNDVFQSFDSVTFNDSVAPGAAKTVSLGSTLAPALLVVDNSNGAYTFNSNGGLAGAGSLVKTGTSSLTIGGADSYAMTGDITAGGGILDFSGKTISIGQLTIAGGGEFNNATATVSSVILQSGSASAILRGAADWTKSTNGTVALTADNQLSGAGTVAEGALLVGNTASPNASGALGTGTVAIAGGASVTFGRSDAAVIANAFSGAGALNLLGSNNGTNGASDFKLTADNSAFSGPLVVTNAKLSLLTGKEIGRSEVTLSGRVSLYATDLIISNAFHVSATGGWGAGIVGSNLNLTNVSLTGPISLAGSTITSVRSLMFGTSAQLYYSSNTISGSISETGGPASLSISSDASRNVLTLSGASTFTGATLIGGQAVVNLTGSLGATAVTVGGLSTIGGTGSIGSGGSLTFNNLAILKVATSGGALTVNGDVNLGPKTTVAVDLTQPPVMGGPIPVLNYTGTLTGTAAQLVMDVPSYYRKAVFDFSPGHITLDIGSKSIIWKGSSGYIWDVGGTKLWNTTGIGETESFYKGDSVLFDDTGSNYVISIYPMEPSSVLFDNNSKNYSVSAKITGPCALTKRGTGGLTLVSSNSHTGGTFIEAGRLEAQLTAMGSGPVSVAAGATLAGDAKIPGPVTIAGTLDPGLASQTWPSVLSTGPAILTGNYSCQLDTNSSDTLAVTGDLNLTGSTLTLKKTFSYARPTVFTIATYTGTLTGRFGSVTGMPPGYVLRYDTVGKQILVAASGVDLEVSIAASPEPAVAGTNLTYTLQARNNSPLDAENVSITDTLPAGTTFVSLTTPDGWAPTTPLVGGAGSVKITKTLFADNSTATFTLVVKVAPGVANGTTISDMAVVTSTSLDILPENNSATSTSTVTTQSDLAVFISGGPDIAPKGKNVTYAYSLSSSGPSDASAPSVSLAIPGRMTFVSATAPKGWTATNPAVGSNGTVVFTKNSLAAGADAYFTVVAKVKSSAPTGSILTAIATGSSTSMDPAPANNRATAVATVGSVNVTVVQPVTTGIGATSQTGLFDVIVKVTNTKPLPINGFRLHVNYKAYKAAFPSLRLYNASSAPGAADVYVDFPYPVAVDAVVAMKLSFYTRTRTRTFPSPFKPVLTVETLQSSQVSGTKGQGVQPRLVRLANKTVLLEFPSVVGKWYRVRYSPDMVNWFDCPVPIQAGNSKMQWIDSGPPFTNVSPARAPNRFYIVNRIAAP